MKILFVNNFIFPDYMNDMVYHGLITKGYDVYETAYPSYMLSNYPSPESLYGKGFSIFAKLNHTPQVESEQVILDKIQSKFYDIVIYGSIIRDTSFLEYVLRNYSKDKIYFIDGEDTANYRQELVEVGTYCKREAQDNRTVPITFGIPSSQLIAKTPTKTKFQATIIPGKLSTYIFDDEESYYQDYALSYIGVTTKKAGWDSMRHYEILANKCLPYFIDLAECPSNTLKYFPKELILESNRYLKDGKLPPDYDILIEELFNYTKDKLTTVNILNQFLN